MVATIVPLVKVARRSWALSSVVYALMSTAGGISIGAGLGLVGTLFGPGSLTSSVLLPLAAVVAAGIEIGVFGLRAPIIAGSVPRDWWVKLGPVKASALYGWVLGMGVTTAIPFAGYYVLLLAALIVGPLHGAILGAVYGLSRAIPVSVASLAVAIGAAHPDLIGGDSLRMRTVGHRASAGALLLAAVAMAV